MKILYDNLVISISGTLAMFVVLLSHETVRVTKEQEHKSIFGFLHVRIQSNRKREMCCAWIDRVIGTTRENEMPCIDNMLEGGLSIWSAKAFGRN